MTPEEPALPHRSDRSEGGEARRRHPRRRPDPDRHGSLPGRAGPGESEGPAGPMPWRRPGPCPPDVLDGVIDPGRVFDRTFTFDRTPDAYRAMADRQVLKALIRP